MKPRYELKIDQLSKRESYTIIQLYIYTIAIVQLAMYNYKQFKGNICRTFL